MCGALRTVLLTGSASLAAVAKATEVICEDCAKECELHAEKHIQCKECGESCEDCIEVCKTLQA